MSTDHDVLRSLLTASPDLVGQVGERVYPWPLRQRGGIGGDGLPAVTFYRVGGRHDVNQDGAEETGKVRFQVDAWARTATESADLSKLVRKALNGQRGEFSGMTLQGAFVADDGDDAHEDEAGRWRSSLDLTLWTEES